MINLSEDFKITIKMRLKELSNSIDIKNPYKLDSYWKPGSTGRPYSPNTELFNSVHSQPRDG